MFYTHHGIFQARPVRHRSVCDTSVDITVSTIDYRYQQQEDNAATPDILCRATLSQHATICGPVPVSLCLSRSCIVSKRLR